MSAPLWLKWDCARRGLSAELLERAAASRTVNAVPPAILTASGPGLLGQDVNAVG
jgi:hypothetical protein